jgi:hypothetical protein
VIKQAEVKVIQRAVDFQASFGVWLLVVKRGVYVWATGEHQPPRPVHQIAGGSVSIIFRDQQPHFRTQ